MSGPCDERQGTDLDMSRAVVDRFLGHHAHLGLHLPHKTLTFLDIDPATGEGKPEMITPTVSNVFDSLWVDLNRHQINHLIRALRKARDQTYGADA